MSESLLPESLEPPEFFPVRFTPSPHDREGLPCYWRSATGENVRLVVLALAKYPQFRAAAVRVEPLRWAEKAAPIKQAPRRARPDLPTPPTLVLEIFRADT